MDGKGNTTQDALRSDRVREGFGPLEIWLSIALQTIGDGAIFVDGDGIIRGLNSIAEALTGWFSAEAEGKPVQDVFSVLQEPHWRPVVFSLKELLKDGLDVGQIPGPLILAGRQGRETLVDVRIMALQGDGLPTGSAVFLIRDCEEQMKALSALRRSEANLRAIFDSNLQIFILMDRDSTILALNPVANQWSRLLIGKEIREGVDRFRDQLPEARLRGFDRNFRRALSGESAATVISAPDMQGNPHWFEVNYTPVFGPGGEVTGVCMNVINVDQRKEASLAAARSEARFRSLVQESSDVILLLSEGGAIVYVSPAIEHMVGYHAEELTGRNAFDLVHPDDRREILDVFAEVLANPDNTMVREFRYLKKDGGYAFLESVARNLLMNPAVEGVVVHCRDISERRRAEEAVRLNLERRAAISAHLPILLYTLETLGLRASSWLSENVQRLTGYTQEQFFQDPLFWEKLIHPADVAAYREAFAVIARTGAANLQYRVRYADGSWHWILDSAVLIRDDAGAPKEIAGATIDVTDRFLAEERLLESEEDFRTLFQSTGEGVILVSEDETIQYSNSSSDELFGVRSGRLVGRNLREFLSESDFAKVREQTEIRKTAKKSTYELRILREDGETRDILLTGAPRFSTDGVFQGAFGIFADITERRRAEEQILRSKLEWEAAFDAVPYLLVLVDGEGQIVRCNKAMAERFGCEFKDLMGKRVYEVFYGHRSGERGVFVAGGSLQADRREIRFPRLQGWFTVAGYPISIPEDSRAGEVFVITDVTRQRAMQAERRRLATAIDNAAEAVMILESEGLAVYVNPSFEDVTGFWADEVLARRPFFWLAGTPLEDGIKGFQRSMVNRVVWRGRIAIATKEGAVRQLEGSLSPIPDAPGSSMGSVIVLRDVTEELALRRKVEKARDMERLGHLVGGVAHEIRNPLNAIQAATEALNMDLGQEEQHRPLLDLIRAQVDRMSGLTRDLLDLGRPIRRSAMAVLPLSKLCEGAIATWHQTSRKRENPLGYEPGAGPGAAVFGDAGKLQQVLINLLDNASQHSKAGTEIRLSTLENGGFVTIRITDLGEGIATANLPRLFEPFFTTKRGGTGLGLSLVKHIMEEHGGDVAGWNNEPPPGCTFEIRLPVSERGEA